MSRVYSCLMNLCLWPAKRVVHCLGFVYQDDLLRGSFACEAEVTHCVFLLLSASRSLALISVEAPSSQRTGSFQPLIVSPSKKTLHRQTLWLLDCFCVLFDIFNMDHALILQDLFSCFVFKFCRSLLMAHSVKAGNI